MVVSKFLRLSLHYILWPFGRRSITFSSSSPSLCNVLPCWDWVEILDMFMLLCKDSYPRLSATGKQMTIFNKIGFFRCYLPSSKNYAFCYWSFCWKFLFAANILALLRPYNDRVQYRLHFVFTFPRRSKGVVLSNKALKIQALNPWAKQLVGQCLLAKVTLSNSRLIGLGDLSWCCFNG